VIDPDLVYSTFAGGSTRRTTSVLTRMATLTSQAFDRTYNGRDAFVAKLSLSGSTLVSRINGGGGTLVFSTTLFR